MKIWKRMKGEGGMSTESMLLWLGLAAAVLVALVASWKSGGDDQKIQQEMLNVISIQSRIKQSFTAEPDFSGLSTGTAISLGIFPQTMIKSGMVRNAWGGAVTVNQNGGDATRFDINYAGVPGEPCARLASVSKGSWVAVSVNGASIPQLGAGGVTAATAACAGGDKTISFTSSN